MPLASVITSPTRLSSSRHPEVLPGPHKRVHARLDALWAGEPRRATAPMVPQREQVAPAGPFILRGPRKKERGRLRMTGQGAELLAKHEQLTRPPRNRNAALT